MHPKFSRFCHLVATVPQCEQIWLGTDIGFANVMTYHDESGDCEISLAELGKVCTGQFFQSCLAFLDSSEGMKERCDSRSCFHLLLVLV
jgi:hypothetical protein